MVVLIFSSIAPHDAKRAQRFSHLSNAISPDLYLEIIIDALARRGSTTNG